LISNKRIKSGVLIYFSYGNLFSGTDSGKKSCLWHLRSLPDTYPSSTFPLYTTSMKMVKIWKAEIDEGQLSRHYDQEITFNTREGDWGRRL